MAEATVQDGPTTTPVEEQTPVISVNVIPDPSEPKIEQEAVDVPISTEHSHEHSLESSWTLYYDSKFVYQPGRQQEKPEFNDFAQGLKKLGSFDSVEAFFRHYAYLCKPNDLPNDHNYFMFRGDLFPAWETFPQGGCWIITVRKRNGLINRLWEELLFACIGELFEEADVVGVELSTRPHYDRLSVWNRDVETQFKIGDALKTLLNLDESTVVEYKKFSSALKDGSTFRNAKPYVYAARSNAAQ